MSAPKVIALSAQELKTRTSEILHRLREEENLEFVIIHEGKAGARLVPLKKRSEIPWPERISTRGRYRHLPEATDADFEEAKRIWEPRPIE
jgi:antitoxin (DNA-binding transcriptional repressor) of toxin-antitoxin stability system